MGGWESEIKTESQIAKTKRRTQEVEGGRMETRLDFGVGYSELSSKKFILFF